MLVVGRYASSTAPSQSSSSPSQSLSVPVVDPATQLSTTLPPTQERVPVRAHTPTPHIVATGVYAMGSQTFTVRTAAELVTLLGVPLAVFDTTTVNEAPESAATGLASV